MLAWFFPSPTLAAPTVGVAIGAQTPPGNHDLYDPSVAYLPLEPVAPGLAVALGSRFAPHWAAELWVQAARGTAEEALVGLVDWRAQALWLTSRQPGERAVGMALGGGQIGVLSRALGGDLDWAGRAGGVVELPVDAQLTVRFDAGLTGSTGHADTAVALYPDLFIGLQGHWFDRKVEPVVAAPAAPVERM